MTRAIPALAILVALTAAAAAQVAPNDAVTVTSGKTRAAIQAFVGKLSTSTRISGKIARWETGICVSVVGIRPEAVRFVVQRVRDTAARVGAPVDGDAACHPNIHITFTTTPQVLLDNIRNSKPYLLGYADSAASLDALAKVSLPIQAWYATQIRDRIGRTEYESSRGMVGEGRDTVPGVIIPYAIGAFTATHGRLSNGLHSIFYNAIIVANPEALLDHEMGTLADYIAMLALAQTQPLTQCPVLPSILSLFVPGCAAAGLTPQDEGYLRGLYSMDAGTILQGQRDQMVYSIGESIMGR